MLLLFRLLEKDVLEASDRTCRDMDKVKHDLHKKAAYQQVLREFKVNDFKTLQKGFHPRHIQTPATYHRWVDKVTVGGHGHGGWTRSRWVDKVTVGGQGHGGWTWSRWVYKVTVGGQCHGGWKRSRW